MIARELETILHHAFVTAREARHRFITPEHLLLRLLDRDSVVKQLETNSVDVAALRVSLQDNIDQTPTFPASVDEPDTQPTIGFQKVIQQAILTVQTDGRREVTVLDVLASLLGAIPGLEGAMALSAGQLCALCGTLTTPDSCTEVENRGVLCGACVAAVIAACRLPGGQ